MASNDLISIIIPVKNEKDRIKAIIDGLYKQTYRPIEVIFVDGDSTDGTVEEIMNAIKEYSSDDFKVRLLRESDFGPIRSPANARNIGALNASGKYVAFFDADFDLRSDPEAVSKIVSGLEKSHHVVITYIPNAHTFIERQQALETAVLFGYKGKPLYLLAGFHKSIFKKHMFNVNLGLGEDIDFAFKVSPNREYYIVDTNIRRCFPHTLHELKRQQMWYGRTAILYFSKGMNYSSRKILLHLIRINGIMLATILLLILIVVINNSFSLIPLVYIIFRISQWLCRDINELKLNNLKDIFERLIYILIREYIVKFFFDLGIIYYILKRGKVALGR
jgi:glycosyltransferase involved in cell wall biosynthesis